MLIPGLVSVTFRKLSRLEIIEAMKKASLSAIEWGGDVHVPCLSDADEFIYENAVTEAASLSEGGQVYIASYGSYYRCDSKDFSFCDAALSIGAPNIRVWAGKLGSAQADAEYRAKIVRNIREVCAMVAPHGITVSTEFHGGTLTDEYESAVRLINEVEMENFCTYWQPNQFRDEEYNIAALKSVLPYLSNVHVFTWDSKARYPLIDGEERWKRYIDLIRSYDDRTHHFLMEFVKDDSLEQFYADAEVLKKWVE